MTETARKLIEVARERRTLWQMARYPQKGFCNPNRRAVADLIRRQRARFGRTGALWFICYQGKPIVTPPWRQSATNPSS